MTPPAARYVKGEADERQDERANDGTALDRWLTQLEGSWY
jgi:hypothetical protein